MPNMPGPADGIIAWQVSNARRCWPDSRVTPASSEDYWDRADLRSVKSQFTKELLRDRGETVGRVDSRFKGDSINLLGEKACFTIRSVRHRSAIFGGFMSYYRTELGVKTDQEYVVSGKLWKALGLGSCAT